MSDVEITFSVGEEVLVTQQNEEIVSGTITGELFEKEGQKYYLVANNGEETEVPAEKIMRNLSMASNRMASMNVYAGR